MITDTLSRTSGRTSAASVPSLASTRIVSCDADRLAITWVMRGSSARASRSMSSEQPHLVGVAQRLERVDRRIQAAAALRAPGLQRAGAAGAGDRARRMRRLEQRRQHDLVRIGEARLLAGERAHADAVVDAVRAVLDDAVLERPRLLADQLEVDVGVVHRVAHDVAEHARDAVLVEAGGQQQAGARAWRAGRTPRPAAGAGDWGVNRAGGIWICMDSGGQAPVLDGGEILPDLALPHEVDVGRPRPRCRAAAAPAPCPSSRRSSSRRGSRGRSRGSRTAPARPRGTGSRWRAPAAASPSAPGRWAR